MKIYLCAQDKALFDAWKLQCREFDFVEVTKQSILYIKAEALVSPANSFGVMSGGIDLMYRNYFGKGMEEELQQRILGMYFGEMPVGVATSVLISHPEFTYKRLISAPTMRTPENVSHTINAYLATRAALIEALLYDMESITFPGMATGTGHISPDDCARQMSAAIRDILIEERHKSMPDNVWDEQKRVRRDIAGTKWLETQRY